MIEKKHLNLAGNLNLGRSYLITTVTLFIELFTTYFHEFTKDIIGTFICEFFRNMAGTAHNSLFITVPRPFDLVSLLVSGRHY